MLLDVSDNWLLIYSALALSNMMSLKRLLTVSLTKELWGVKFKMADSGLA